MPKENTPKSENIATLKISVTAALATIITVSSIYGKEEYPHIHSEKYNNNLNFSNYELVVAGTSLTSNLPNYLIDLGASPSDPNENLFGVTSVASFLKR